MCINVYNSSVQYRNTMYCKICKNIQHKLLCWPFSLSVMLQNSISSFISLCKHLRIVLLINMAVVKRLAGRNAAVLHIYFNFKSSLNKGSLKVVNSVTFVVFCRSVQFLQLLFVCLHYLFDLNMQFYSKHKGNCRSESISQTFYTLASHLKWRWAHIKHYTRNLYANYVLQSFLDTVVHI